MSVRQARRARQRQLERAARRRRRIGRLGAAAGAGLGASVLFAPAAEAATFTVTSLADTDETEGTLREEVEDANDAAGADTIVFQAGLTGTITLTAAAGGAIEIYDDSLDIQGPGADLISISGGGQSRVFTADSFNEAADDLIVSGLTLTDGDAEDGGAIHTERGAGFAPHLTITNSVLTGNEADQDGGAIHAFYSPLTVTASQVTNNDAGVRGGGIFLYGADEDGDDDPGGVVISGTTISGNTSSGGGGGGSVYGVWDDLLVETSTISGNTSGGDGGGLIFYGNGDDVPTTIDRSTFSGNTSGDEGGGISLLGSFTSSKQPGPVVIQNSTFSGNTAAFYGGAIDNYNSDDTPRTIRNSTIVGNTAGTDAGATSDNIGGGVHTYAYDNVAGADEDVLVISSSIIANNGPQDLGDNSLEPPEGSIEVGFSLVENPGSSLVVESPAGSNLLGVDPQLGPLAGNGGPTQTHAPLASSPAIDAGIPNGLPTDQRGAQRTFDAANVANRAGSAGTDIGSVELLPGGRLSLAQCKGATENVLFTPGTAIVGTDANDVIVGTDADDQISSAKGKDKVCAGAGNDAVKAGAGKDNVSGQKGKDRIKGNGGNDKLAGNAGRDTLKGGAGKDTLKGGGGKDKLVGGPGRDKLKGGGGKDSERQ
jgi:hypothetical protein